MKLRSSPHPDDLAKVKTWFRSLADCVQAIDYPAARPLFAEDMLAFGTFTDFVGERDHVEREQWRKVWGTIRNFRWRLDDIEAIVATDRLSAVGIGIFDSDGFNADGQRYDRRGRATIAFARAKAGDPWVAVHSHMSLFRGTPDRSHGSFD